MGIGSNWAVEVAEANYLEQKEEWIRDELDDPEADQFTDGWHELEEEYDMKSQQWDDYLEAEYEWHHSQNHSNFFISFSRSIDDIKTILKSNMDMTVKNTIYKMVHVHAVTALETYLGDSLKSAVIGNKEYIANAAKNLDELTKTKFTLEVFLSEDDFVAKKVLGQLCKYLYHDVTRVMMIYKATLEFHCNFDLKELIDITTIRHDLVHRNGKDNDGKPVQLDVNSLTNTIYEIEKFVKYLDENLTEHHGV